MQSTALQTAAENLGVLEERARIVGTQTKIGTAQFCRELIATQTDIFRLWESFIEACSQPTAEGKVQLCRELCRSPEHLARILELLTWGETEALLPNIKKKIAYVRNKRNDKIFLKFSDLINGGRAHYVATFADACEAVFNGECEYCILPVSNGRDGRLYSFYNLLDRYELKILYTVNDEASNGTDSARYALAGRNLSIAGDENTHKRFEFSVSEYSGDFIADVISVLVSLGGTLADVDTRPLIEDESRHKFYFTAELDGEAVMPFALYMYLQYAAFSAVGISSI